jgi:hypothetical protein
VRSAVCGANADGQERSLPRLLESTRGGEGAHSVRGHPSYAWKVAVPTKVHS